MPEWDKFSVENRDRSAKGRKVSIRPKGPNNLAFGEKLIYIYYQLPRTNQINVHSLAIARQSLDFCRNDFGKNFSTESLQGLTNVRPCVSKLDVTNVYFSRVFPIYFPSKFDHKSRDHMIALSLFSPGDQVKVPRIFKGPDFLKNFLLIAKNLLFWPNTQSQSVETVYFFKIAAQKIHVHFHVRLTFSIAASRMKS